MTSYEIHTLKLLLLFLKKNGFNKIGYEGWILIDTDS